MIYSYPKEPLNEGFLFPTKKGQELSKENIRLISEHIEDYIEWMTNCFYIINKALNILMKTGDMTDSERDKIEEYTDEINVVIKKHMKEFTLEKIEAVYKYKEIRFANLADRLFDKDTSEAYKNLVKKCAKDGEYSKQLEKILEEGQKISDRYKNCPMLPYEKEFYLNEFGRTMMNIARMTPQLAIILRGVETNKNMRPKHESNIFSECVMIGGQEVLNESVKSRLKSIIDRINIIRDLTPKDNEGEDYIKNFVDTNYKDIIKCCKILEKEKKDLDKQETASLIGVGVSLAAGIVGSIASSAAVIIPAAIFMLLSLIVSCLIMAVESEKKKYGNKSFDGLIAIRNKLLSVNVANVSDSYKNRMQNIVDKINDSCGKYIEAE